jgi:hypothetical protein
MYAGSRSYHLRGHEYIVPHLLSRSGDVVRGNSTKRLSLLEKLGYVLMTPVTVNLDEIASPLFLYRLLTFPKSLDPEIVTFECIKDVPDHLIF